jgi:hypothetical protein
MDATTDLVIGWRARRADPPLRLLNAWGWKLLVNAMFGYTARDVDCAFKLFRRSVWTDLEVHSRGATFSAELMIKARRRGYRVKERPVSHAADPSEPRDGRAACASACSERQHATPSRRGLNRSAMRSERLVGLLLLLAGAAGLVLIYLMFQGGWFQPTRPVRLPGSRPDSLPALNPLFCLLPLMFLGSIGLALLGLRKFLTPDSWEPPRHQD